MKRRRMLQSLDVVTACRDPKDNKFLELAVSGHATHIITGLGHNGDHTAAMVAQHTSLVCSVFRSRSSGSSTECHSTK